MKNSVLFATIAALSAQIIFGFSFMFTKISLNITTPLTVIADRYIVAFISLTIVMLFKRVKIKYNKDIWKLVVMSFFQPVLYFLFESYGIQATTSGFSSIMISLIPVVSMFSGIVFLKEVPSLMQYFFTALSVLGVVVMAILGKADGTVTVWGIILLFGAVVSSVGYNTLSRKTSKEFTAFERTYAMTFIGLVVFVLIAFFENIHNPVNIFIHFSNFSYLTSIIYLGIVSSVVAFLLLNYANTYLPVAKTTVFSNITTVISLIAGVMFLDEKFSIQMVVSAVMIIVGVWGVQVLNVKNKVN